MRPAIKAGRIGCGFLRVQRLSSGYYFLLAGAHFGQTVGQ
jgi:hypothetical protein